MKRTLLIAFLAIPVLSMGQAKQLKQKSAAKSSTSAVSPKQWSLQVQAGTQGVGADVRYGILPKLSLRAGASFAPLSHAQNFDISGFKASSTQNVDFANLHLLADYTPFAHARGLRLVAGAGYLYKASGHVNMVATGNYTFANYNLTGDQVGTLDMNVLWKGVAPYAGIGLFKSFPNHLFNINLDLGTYYLTAPTTHINGTKLFVDNNQLEPQFNDNLKDYRWLPVIQLNFNFRIK